MPATTNQTLIPTASTEEESRKTGVPIASEVEATLAIAIPPALEKRIDGVEVEFVHDGKGLFSPPKIAGFRGAKVSERVQIGAPPHAIVLVRSKRPERDPDTRVRTQDRFLDATGNQLSYAVNNTSGLALDERNSIPLLGLLPQGDAPKAVSEGVVATG